METSSPRHKPLPGLHPGPDPEKALPKGADRRGLEARAKTPVPPSRTPVPPSRSKTPVPPSRNSAPAATPLPAPVAAVQPPPPAATPAPPPPLPVQAAAPTSAIPAAPTPPPPAQQQPTPASGGRATAVTRTVSSLTAKRQAGPQAQMPRPLNWRPRKRKAVEAEPADVIPVVAAPRFSERRRPWALAGSVTMLADMTGGFGELVPFAHAEPHCVPAAVTTFSEILSLAMDGFLCERRLKVDPAPYAPSLPESEVATANEPVTAAPAREPEQLVAVPGTQAAVARATEAEQDNRQEEATAAAPSERVPASPGLGASEALAPKPAGGQAGAQPVQAFPCDVPVNEAAVEGSGHAAARPRAELSLESSLPAVVDEEARLDWLAARHEPGMVRLRSPRVRSPQSARLVKPAAGSSGMPIRLRPSVRPPATGGLTLPKLAMPRGSKVALGFDCSVAGRRAIATVCEPHVTPRFSAWSVTGPRLATRLALDRATRVPVPVPAQVIAAAAHVPTGEFVTAGSGGPGATATTAAANLALPRAPYVEGTIFDPPSFGLVGLELKLKQAAEPAPVSQRANPAARPVVSYKWKPALPEMAVAAGGEGPGSSRSTRSRMAQLTFERAAVSAPPRLATGDAEPVRSAAEPDRSRVRLELAPAGAIVEPGMTTRVFPLSINETPREAGPGQPQAMLDQITPAIPHQLRKSPLRTQADWQRSRWASASVYGSAIWRIAIGKFSGALDQAPTPVRWLAAVTALALAAFALLPDRKPAAPDDNNWTIAKMPGIAAPAEAAPQAPTPKRTVRVVAPPPQTVPAAAAAPAPVAPPVSRRAATRGRRGQAVQTTAPGETDSPMGGLSSVWDNFQRRLAERSAIAFTDDFRNGLADWEGAGDWARSWSYDASGFVRTGALALLAPAREMTDYRMEFLGQIERRSMGWVVRAADVRNYYAIKLTLVGDGPIPEVALIRYPVINGVAGAATQQTLPLDVRSDTVYRVQTEVRGDYFAITVQGKVVDSWTDARLKRGGVGLFSGKGELARVRWVGVWHQYDTLGRLCALLAPSGLPGRERGVNQ